MPLLLRLFALLLASSALAGEISRTPLVLSKGGTPDHPEVFDGKGLVIDLGTDVTNHAWKKEGDLWTSNGPLLQRPPLLAGQTAGLFVDEHPIPIPRDLEKEKAHPEKKGFCYIDPASLRPGLMGYGEDGSLYFRWPENQPPGSARLVLPAKAGVSAVVIACSHIVVRNVTAMHAGNDGFNIHNGWTGIRLENIRALSNGDEGISAHDEVEMTVDGAEIAWNGSVSGGVADVNHCTTTYRNCVVHHNAGAAFHFSGKSHSVSDSEIHHQPRPFDIAKETAFTQTNVRMR